MNQGNALLRGLAWLARHVELGLAALVLFLAAAVWAFAELAAEVIEGDTHAFDEALLLALRTPGDLSNPIGPEWVEELGRDFTALGGVGVLTLLTLATAGLLWLMRQRASVLFLLASVLSGIALSSLAKSLFARPRPDLVPHESIVYTASFPSGHSMMAAVTYLTLAVLVARTLPEQRLKVYVLALAILVTLLVGISRVYLGVHWPTDVLAGWTAGAGWALACATIARALSRRGRIEPQADGDDRPEGGPPGTS